MNNSDICQCVSSFAFNLSFVLSIFTHSFHSQQHFINMDDDEELFTAQGSQDKNDNLEIIKGNEMSRSLSLMPKKLLFIISIVTLLITATIPYYSNILLGKFINDMSVPFVPSTNLTGAFYEEAKKEYIINTAFKTSLLMLVTTVVLFVMNDLTYRIRAYVGPCYTVVLRQLLFDSIMGKDIEFFDSTTTGVLISRLSEDIILMRQTYHDKFLDSTELIIEGVTGIIVACIYSWQVTAVCMASIPVIGGFYWFGQRCINSLWADFNSSTSAAASTAEEVITSFRIVKSFDNEMKESERYNMRLGDVYGVIRKASIAHAVSNSIFEFLVWGLLFVIVYYSGYLVLNGKLKIGDSLIIGSALMLAAQGASVAFTSLDDYKKAKIAAAKVFHIVDSNPVIETSGNIEYENANGLIEFRDVRFKYPGSSNYALDGLTFTISPGETVAFVGESGCGKTTTLSLLQRFYDIESGEILLDQQNIKDLKPFSLRKLIAIVPQGPVLFSMSICDNIRFSNPEATPQEVHEAAQSSNAHDFIMQIKDNYDSPVQQSSLSGGQKQRICIARAILAKTPILLLDEATAALDSESEQLVQKSIDELRNGKTMIIVAHRLSTVKNADRILVFKQGKLIEEGTHDELLQLDSHYAMLVKYQLH